MQLLDGAMGTELLRRGYQPAERSWTALANRDCGHLVQNIHRDYAEAGATVHTANTFRCRPRDTPAWKHLARLAVEHARAAVPLGHRVFASIGPEFDCYKPHDWSGYDRHQEVLEAFNTLDVDGFLLETFAHPVEAVRVVALATQLAVPERWLALTAGPEATLQTPQSMASVAKDAVAAGATAILVNCTCPIRTIEFVQTVANTVDCPVGAYANGGPMNGEIGWTPTADGLRTYGTLAREWSIAGATILGGCCGTGPEHIRAIRHQLQR